MAEVSQAKLEQEVGDHTRRVRLINDILERGVEFREQPTDPHFYGPLEVSNFDNTEGLSVTDPDGGSHKVEIPGMDEPERSLVVEQRLRETWEEWLDAL